jgi:molybdenum cofactor cytidylyltransferase
MRPPGEALPLGAIILAGGLSRRMGRPKALLPLGNATFLESIVNAYREAGISSIRVATHGAVAEDPRFPPLDADDLLVLPAPTDSPIETLWRALQTVENLWSAFFVHPVDHPFVGTSTLAAMARVHLAERPPIVQPRHQGTGGHPVLIDMALLPEVRAASPDQGLRQVVRADPGRVLRLAVEDPGILQGINRPEDLAGLDDPNERSEP